MRCLSTVLLEHARRRDRHYDWLFEDPAATVGPADSLVTFRAAVPWRHWSAAGRVALNPLPAHRRRYLTYQGPLSDGRGTVRRVARGKLLCLDWHMGGGVLRLEPASARRSEMHAPLELTLRRRSATRWEATARAASG